MATKNNPGKFDCYEKAEPDEPVFVLLGRDPAAAFCVTLWLALREELDGPGEQIDEARVCAAAMEAWAESRGKREKIERVRALVLEICGEKL